MSCIVNPIVTQINETHIKEKNYVFTWVIKNLNLDFPLDAGEGITSPPFRTDFGLYQLKLYPGGLNRNYRHFMSLEIIVNDISRTAKPRFVISLVNKTGEEDFHYSNIRDIYIETNFVKRCDITSDFLPNGDLTIKWKLYFYIGAEPFESSPTM